jgi:hypothetical protein
MDYSFYGKICNFHFYANKDDDVLNWDALNGIFQIFESLAFQCVQSWSQKPVLFQRVNNFACEFHCKIK